MDIITIPLVFNGFQMTATVNVGEGNPAERVQQAIAFYTSQGFTMPETVAHSAPSLRERLGEPPAQQPQYQQQPPQGGGPACPYHGSAKIGYYQGQPECKFIANAPGGFPFRDNGQGFSFISKRDGSRAYACSWKG